MDTGHSRRARREDAMQDLVSEAIEHLEQFSKYAEDMRKIGRGFYVSSNLTTEHLINCLRAAREAGR